MKLFLSFFFAILAAAAVIGGFLSYQAKKAAELERSVRLVADIGDVARRAFDLGDAGAPARIAEIRASLLQLQAANKRPEVRAVIAEHIQRCDDYLAILNRPGR